MLVWEDDTHLCVGASRFLTYGHGHDMLDAATLLSLLQLRSDEERFVLAKTRRMIDRYTELLLRLRPRAVLELGVYQGGSVVFMEELIHPAKLVAIDLDESPIPALDEWIDSQRDRVALYQGIDQSDRPRVERIVEREFAEPLDLVIDDASHFYEETRASFNFLFPLLRTGGLYLIEDWAWEVWMRPELHTDKASPSRLVADLVMETVRTPDVVPEVQVWRDLVAVHRGPMPRRDAERVLDAEVSPR
jgi:predicted O-methyltransferase YrrM